MDIFESILKAAKEGAAHGVVERTIASTNFDGTAIVPTDNFVLPVQPLTKSLYKYQLAAVENILNKRRVLLGLQAGLGKTAIIQAVVAAEALQGRRSLIVVPPSLRLTPWDAEFAADYPQLNVAVVTGTKHEPLPDVDVVIIGDSVLTARIADIQAWNPSNVFFDEAHRLKSRDAKRSKAALTIAESLSNNDIVVCATGTVVANRVTDVYQPLRITGAENATAVSGGHSWSRFMNTWCFTEMRWTGRANVQVATGCKDPEGLRAALTRSCYISIPREDVLDLPERTTSLSSLVVNGDANNYRRIEKQFLSWVRETRGDAAMHRAAKAEAITKLMALWEQDGLAKVNASVEYISALVEQGEKVVVFAHHQSVVLELFRSLSEANVKVDGIVGGMSSEQKAAVVDRFQNGDLEVVIGNIDAAGTGLTLHASRHVVFVQLPWSSGVYSQACDRVYRIGQKRHVVTHVLNLHGGVSEHLWNVLVQKAADADAINTGTPSTIDHESVQEAVLSKYNW